MRHVSNPILGFRFGMSLRLEAWRLKFLWPALRSAFDEGGSLEVGIWSFPTALFLLITLGVLGILRPD
jgi:hypothetical protein